MATSLIDQLARRLDLEPDEARDALSHLIAQVKEQLDAQGNASVPGLGRFHTGPDGLTFEPDPALAIAVNQRYAGLKPVTVGSAPTSFRKQEVVAPPTLTPDAPAEPEAPPEPRADATPDTPPEPPSEAPATESAAPDDADDADLDAVLDEAERDTWYPPEPDDEDHPLGPSSRVPYEEADFSVLAGFEETRRADADDEPDLTADTDADTDAGTDAGDDEPRPTEEPAGPLPAVRLPVEGAPEPDFPEDPFADAAPELEPLPPEPAPESSSPFFEEWTPSDFEVEEPEEDDATGETGTLTTLDVDAPEPTPDLEPEAEVDLLEPAEPPAPEPTPEPTPVPPPPAPSRPPARFMRTAATASPRARGFSGSWAAPPS